MEHSRSKRIAIDAMGGDLGPGEVVAGLKLAIEQTHGSLNPVTLVGKEELLRELLHSQGLSQHSDIDILSASEVITMDDKPVAALKRKKDSSMIKAIELVKSGEAGAVLSCGNTGALMACGTIRLRTIAGVDRPALTAIIPKDKGFFVFLDVGANPEATHEHLVHNAVLGSLYARFALGVSKPRVSLLSIGTEEGKGTGLSARTNEILKRVSDAGVIDYRGLMEGFQIFTDHCDVAVCDGFVGNILLKSWESLVHYFSAIIKEEIKASPIRMAGALLARNVFKALKARTNPEIYSGAPLLGLKGNVLKAHGSSNRYAIKHAINTANKFIEDDIIGHLESDIRRTNEIISSVPTSSS